MKVQRPAEEIQVQAALLIEEQERLLLAARQTDIPIIRLNTDDMDWAAAADRILRFTEELMG